MSLVIIEGGDGVGKSSLAREIHAHPTMRNCRLVHAGPPTHKTLLEEYMLPLVHYRPNEDHIVLDRWHLGELVYPKLQNGRKSLVTREEFAYLELFLLSRGALLVHVTADPLSVYRRRTSRREPTVSTAVIAAELALFASAVSSSMLPFQNVHTTLHPYPPELWANRIVPLAHAEREHVHELAQFPTYVGPLRPRILLLGDQRGPTDRRYPTAFGPLPRTSGLFLLRSLPDELLDGPSIGIANANEDDDPYALWELLGRPPVVALGQKALEGCDRSGLTRRASIGAVPHPQWVRRFKHAHAAEYGRLIVSTASTREDARKWLQ